jgi:hypothetical protein
MRRFAIAACLLAVLATGCRKKVNTPDAAANAFLRAVHKEQCDKAWHYFSADSQARIRAESDRVTREQPYYAEQFAPENLCCKSTYANRYLSFVPGSARLQKVEGTNALVIADLREAAAFLIPGFWPTKYTNRPVEMHFIHENGAWKIDLAAAQRDRQADRQKKIQEELDRVARRRQSPF